MSDVADKPTRRLRPLTLITGTASVLVALATFDPHSSNFELISFAIYRLLPVAMAVLIVTGLIWAFKATLHLVVWRHRVLSAILVFLVAVATIGIARAMAVAADGVKRDDLRAYRGGASDLKQVGHDYIHTIGRLVSRAAWIADYRQDMAIRAQQAFADYDVARAKDYLDAGTSSIGGQGGNAAGTRAVSYLVARDVYLANHDARIAALRAQGEVAPILIYLMRAAYAFGPTPQREAALLAEMERDETALDNAKTAFVGCATGQTVQPDLPWPAPLVIGHLAETSGDWPSVRGDHIGWCRLVREAAERRHARSRSKDGDDGSSADDDAEQIFDEFATTFWGDLTTKPARVTRAPASTSLLSDSVDDVSQTDDSNAVTDSTP